MSKTLGSKLKHLITESFRILGGTLLLVPMQAKPAKLTQARALYAQGKVEQAMDVYFDILKHNPKCKEALDELASRAIEQGLNETAHRVLMISTKHYPQSPTTLLNWAFYHQGCHQFEMAATFFETVLKKSPQSVTAKYFLAALKKEETPQKAPIEYVKYVFDSYASRFDHALLKTLQYRAPDNLVKLLKRHINPPQKILDLGCGTGLSGQALLQAYPNLELMVGVDASEQMLSVAQHKKIYHKLYHQEIYDYLENTNEQFDLIVMCDVLPYFGDLKPLFLLIQSKLTETGSFCMCAERAEHGYGLATTGRYKHSAEYIESLLPLTGLHYVSCEISTIRHERGEPVPGLHYLLSNAESVGKLSIDGAA